MGRCGVQLTFVGVVIKPEATTKYPERQSRDQEGRGHHEIHEIHESSAGTERSGSGEARSTGSGQAFRVFGGGLFLVAALPLWEIRGSHPPLWVL